MQCLGDQRKTAKALMRIVDDLVSRTIKTKHIYTAEDREAYAAKFPKALVVKATVESGSGTPLGSSAAATSKKPKGKTAKRSPKKRDRLIPQDCVLGIPPGRINHIEVELRRKLSLENHTNSVSVMFRVFIELSVDEYLAARPISGVKSMDKLSKKIEQVSFDLEKRKKLNKQQGKAVRSINAGNSFLAPGASRMHDYVHNPYIFPAPTDLRQHWNSLQAFVAAMWSA